MDTIMPFRSIEALKEYCSNANPSIDSKMLAIQEYVYFRHSAYAAKTGKLVSLEDTAKRILKKLELGDFVVGNTGSRYWIIPESEHFMLYHDRDECYPVWTREYRLNDFPVIQGRKYTASCIVSYYTFTSGGRRTVKSNLRWETPELGICPHCSRTYDAPSFVFNEDTDEKLCKTCNESAAAIVNSESDLGQPILGYHSHKTRWKFFPQRVAKEKSPYMGIEVEVHSRLENSEDGAKNSARKIILSDKTENNIYFEWDGSLMTGGFEIVSNPMTLEYHTQYWTKLLPIIRESCIGYDVEAHHGDPKASYSYGIHITVNRKFIPESMLAKFAKFFDNKENQQFLWAIAQRRTIYGGWALGAYNKPKAGTQLTMDLTKKKYVSKERRMPVNVKEKLVEFRMFRSTLNTTSFMKNIEFMDAMIKFFSEELGADVSHTRFINWLIQPENKSRYPYLITYLSHPVYSIKGVGLLKNAWLPLIKSKEKKKFDPYAEYGPVILQRVDPLDQMERSMV